MAVAFAAAHLLKSDPNATMVVLSADHFIQPKERLLELLKCGATIAERDDVLITIGINPTRPETGYGYIEQGEIYDTFDGISTFAVKQFKEKPSAHWRNSTMSAARICGTPECLSGRLNHS